MSAGMFIQTLFEVIAVAFVIWGLFNEQKLVKFEDRIKSHFKRRKLRIAACNRAYNTKHCA